ITFGADAKNALMSHAWPGNVRELDNAIQRALVLQQGNVIHTGDLCLELGITGRPAAPAPVAARPASDDGFAQPGAPEDYLRTQPAEDDLPAFGGDEPSAASSLGSDLRQQEFRIIIQTLKQERGRRNRAAEQLGISPRTLRYKLAQMRDAGIDLDTELAMA
ncbi:helix-turn-helix domain-containing protein, partial [Marinobacter alexandrii]